MFHNTPGNRVSHFTIMDSSGQSSVVSMYFSHFNVHFLVIMTVGLLKLSPAIKLSVCSEVDLISVEFRFEGSFRRNAQVVGLRLGEFGEVDSQVI